MDAPKCRLCGKRHWNLCPSESAPAIVVPPHLAEGAKALLKNTPIMVAEPLPVKQRAPRGTFDRAAYQREYMRKRRAAEKQQKP